jgi:hypothetical protein
VPSPSGSRSPWVPAMRSRLPSPWSRPGGSSASGSVSSPRSVGTSCGTAPARGHHHPERALSSRRHRAARHHADAGRGRDLWRAGQGVRCVPGDHPLSSSASSPHFWRTRRGSTRPPFRASDERPHDARHRHGRDRCRHHRHGTRDRLGAAGPLRRQHAHPPLMAGFWCFAHIAHPARDGDRARHPGKAAAAYFTRFAVAFTGYFLSTGAGRHGARSPSSSPRGSFWPASHHRGPRAASTTVLRVRSWRSLPARTSALVLWLETAAGSASSDGALRRHPLCRPSPPDAIVSVPVLWTIGRDMLAAKATERADRQAGRKDP